MYTIRVSSDLVQISVVARDRKGRFVSDLTKDDFGLIEDGRPQQLSAVDLETVALPNITGTPLLPLQLPILTSGAAVPPAVSKGLRLVLLLFDFMSLHPDDAARSLRAAEAYVRTIGPADRVAIVSLAPELEVQQDFTSDQKALQKALERLHGLSSTVVERNGNDTASDDSARAMFNGYRRLRSLRVLTSALARVSQKKSVVIFAGKAGSDSDLADVAAAVDAAVRSRVSFYGVDATGLSATPPLGDATQPSSYGTTVLSGAAVAQGAGATIHDQDWLYALARGTGGRAFFDSNDFERPFQTLEDDTREYYILSYRSSNSRRDGRFRHIAVHVRPRGLELKYQVGYYSPRDETHVSARDADRVLAEELSADLPLNDLPIFGFANHVRMGKDLFYVPITIILPAEDLVKDGIASSAVVGVVVRDDRGRPVRKLRYVIPDSVLTQQPTAAVQYETATELPAGEYNVRVVVVQNGTRQVGSFSIAVRLRQRDQSPLAVSLLFGGTLAAATSNSPKSPFVLNGSRLILNPLGEYWDRHPFAMQYQVECGGSTHDHKPSCDATQIRSSLQCFSSDERVFNAEPLAMKITADTAVFRVEFPAGSFHPGTYKCHVTAVNPESATFAFGAAQLRVRDELATPAFQASSTITSDSDNR